MIMTIMSAGVGAPGRGYVQAGVKADHAARGGILEADTRRREGGLRRGVVLLVESKDNLIADIGELADRKNK